MKRLLTSIIILSAVILTGCDDETVRYIDNTPAVPQGVYSITGDNAVYIYWLPVQDDDLDYYRVWWSPDDDVYELMATTDDEYYIDTDVENGTTYYYAVSAVDRAGQESALSYETVFDTPRPEGTNLFMADFHQMPEDAGYDFSEETTLDYNDDNADVYLEYDDNLETFFLYVTDVTTDIQDVGYTYDFDEIGYAPDGGWSAVGWTEVIEGHTYIIWTRDNHFAKLRAYNFVGAAGVQFQWAYQTAEGNPELARPQHDDNYLKRTINGTIIK
nr:fibronectin type III domain-containing protein [candidate division Zixibacteria bacterium]